MIASDPLGTSASGMKQMESVSVRKPPLRLAYVIYNERPMSGLVKTQVMDVLKAIKRRDPSIDVTLIAFWQPWVRLRFAEPLVRMREELAAAGIRQRDFANVYVPSRHFLYRRSLFPVLLAWATVIFRRALAERYDIVQARSYFSSYVTARLKHAFGHKVIFDMRSLFPLEHVTVGTWRIGDRAYCAWRQIEAWTIANSEGSVAVTSGMIDEILAVDAGARAALIPIAVDTERLQFNPDARTRIRVAEGWGDRLVVCYQGSLGRGYLWNNIENYAPYFQRILGLDPDAHFLVLTPDIKIGIEGVLEAAGIPPERVTIREASPRELPAWLSAADIGMHVMSPGPDSHTRLGVKVTEYLSCGLPILVNSNVGAAAALVREHGVGCVVDLGETDATSRLRTFLASDLAALRTRCRRLAEEMFAVDHCAARYVALYNAVLKRDNEVQTG